MRLLPVLLAVVGAWGIAAACSPARAEWDDDGWQHHEWRERQWQEQRWREHEWRERQRQSYALPPVIYAPLPPPLAYTYAPPAYYAAPPPAYYAPPPAAYYAPPPPPPIYQNPGVSIGFGFGFR